MPPLVLVFIRATRTHLVGGQPGDSYRLVRSVGQDGKVRQKTLLNLGADFSLPRALWPRVTRLTEGLLAGQAPLPADEPEVRAATETLVRMQHPFSEREALRWLRDSSAALELLGIEPGQPLSLIKLYRTSDLL